MRLTRKSHLLIETIFMTGLDAILNAGQLSSLYKGLGNWEYDYQSKRQLDRLKEKGWIIWDDSRESANWVAKITKEATDLLSETLDPHRYWDASWDGKWRTLTYDLPEIKQAERKRLETWLAKMRFGSLQGSVRISPRSDASWDDQVTKLKVDPSAVFVIEGTILGKTKPSKIVSKAWDFEKINQLHKAYQNFVSKNQPSPEDHTTPIESYTNWHSEESKMWKEAIEADPLLPAELLPSNYPGKDSWELRTAAYQTWTQILAKV